MRNRRRGPVNARIDVAVQRSHALRAQSVAQLGERPTTGVAQHEIETGKPGRADIRQRFAATQAAKRDRGIEIVKHAKPAARGHCKLGRGDCVRTIRCDDHGIRLAGVLSCAPARRFPIVIENERAAGDVVAVARAGIVGHVAFIEDHRVVSAVERAAQPAPERGMAIAPRRTDGEAEDHDLHAGTIVFNASTLPPRPLSSKPVTAAGAISTAS